MANEKTVRVNREILEKGLAYMTGYSERLQERKKNLTEFIDGVEEAIRAIQLDIAQKKDDLGGVILQIKELTIIESLLWGELKAR